MLCEVYKKNSLEKDLLFLDEIKIFPKITNRKQWDNLPLNLKNYIIKKGEDYLAFNYQILTASRYLDYNRNGNRSKYEDIYFKRRYVLGFLTIAECIENKGRFLDDIINGIWCICEETSWAIPAHNIQYTDEPLPNINKPIIDLFASETGAMLSSIYYLIGVILDKISKNITQRIKDEVKIRILDPYLDRDDFWWMCLKTSSRGINNWNPWCNSNCLLTFFLLENDPKRKTQAISKCLMSLDVFINSYHEDGGCDEGVLYWARAGASLFECLEIFYIASNGRFNVYDREIIKNIGRFVYRSHIHKNYFINFADSSASVELPVDLIYRFGKRINDDNLKNLGSYLFQIQSLKNMFDYCFPMFRSIYAILDYKEISSNKALSPYIKDAWLNGIKVMSTREKEGTYKGLYLAAKAGHNNESHNHNDIGQFIIYSDGFPVIIDVGVETYTAKTFSKDRYQIWTMQSAYHNLPTINKIQQHAGKNFKATQVNYKNSIYTDELSMNIAKAYPNSSGLISWKRVFKLNRQNIANIEIIDSFTLNKSSDDIILSLMTPCKHELSNENELIFKCSGARKIKLEFDNNKLLYKLEKIEINDKRLGKAWGNYLYRILLKYKKGVKNDSLMMKFTQI